MDAKAVHDAIVRLHAELAGADSVPPELRRELEAALRDVERALGQREAPLAERFESLTARFEAPHPALAEALGGLVRALARMGI